MDLTNYRDPLFYHEPLHLHYNRSIAATGSKHGHETGDRIRSTTETRWKRTEKTNSRSSGKVDKKRRRESVRCHGSTRVTKAREKRSRSLVNKRLSQKKNIRRASSTRGRQQASLKRRCPRSSASNAKRKGSKPAIASRKKSCVKVTRTSSAVSAQRRQKLNVAKRCAPSTMSPSRCLSTSIHRLFDSPKFPIASKNNNDRSKIDSIHSMAPFNTSETMDGEH